jgi:hypothetical protein
VLDIVLFVELDEGERVACAPGETRLVARLGGSAEQLREDVRRIVYGEGDRLPRWLDLTARLAGRGVSADDAEVPTRRHAAGAFYRYAARFRSRRS